MTPTPALDIAVTATRPPDASVELRGRFDALEASRVRGVLDDLVDHGFVQLLVDLYDVDFVDSAGLAALVRAMKRTRRGGGDVRLVMPRHLAAVRVFELTRFDRVFTMTERAARPGERSGDG